VRAGSCEWSVRGNRTIQRRAPKHIATIAFVLALSLVKAILLLECPGPISKTFRLRLSLVSWCKEDAMKLTPLALLASISLGGYVEAQTTPEETTPVPAESKPGQSHQHPLSSACRKEVSNLCGTTHGKEMMNCVKENLDSNKFSADCQSELKEHAKQPAKAPS
jgi:hypothetical protein